MRTINLSPYNYTSFKQIPIGEVFRPATNEDYYYIKIQSLHIPNISPNNVYGANAVIVGKTDRGINDYIGKVEAFPDATRVTTYPNAYICLNNEYC